MPERLNEFTLYYLNQKLRDDLGFSEDALNMLLQIESQQPEFLRSTYTLATSASGLINNWLVERKLTCYRRGRAIDDVTTEVITVLNDDIGRAIDSDDASVSIKRDEFLSLLKEEGVLAPSFLLDTAPPEESESDTPTKVAPLQRQRHQENEILRVIAELGYNAKALPKDTPAKPGAKAAVRKELPEFSPTVFDKAWDRLSASKEIIKLK